MRRSRGPGRAVVTSLVFAGWTLFVWVGRLRNLIAEPGSVLDASRWSLVGSLAFTVLGVLVAVGGLAHHWGRTGRPLPPAVAALAALTIGVWLLRGADIAAGDHSPGFIIVHLGLAVVSIGLALVTLASVRRLDDGGRDPGDGGTETTSGRLPSKRWVSL